MNLLSIQVGTPRHIPYKGHDILTSFFKKPVAGPVVVKTFNITGDEQADLRVHGGRDKAVYAYSADAYPFWNSHYNTEHKFGSLGENLTFDELDEDKIMLGDVYELGECRLQVTQPRFPCYKLNLRFKDAQAVKIFDRFGRPGVYFRVLREGEIATGQTLALVKREGEAMSVKEMFRMKMHDS